MSLKNLLDSVVTFFVTPLVTLGILDCSANDNLAWRAEFCFGKHTHFIHWFSTSVENACWVKMLRWVQRTEKRAEAACGGWFIEPVI